MCCSLILIGAIKNLELGISGVEIKFKRDYN